MAEEEDDVCVRRMCTRIMLRFLLYSTYPGEWKTNVFKPAPFVPVDVCAREQRVFRVRDNKDESPSACIGKII